MTLDATLLLQSAAMAAGSQQYPAGALYVVATPIGNLADLSLRAIHVLSLVDMVGCEDTRTTQRLLQHLGLGKRLLAVHEHNENAAAAQVVQALQAGQRVAYVSDAGTPGISDPGARLVRAVQEAGLRVVPLPGASAPACLVSVAGDVHGSGFTFAGFLPTKGAARREALAALASNTRPVVLFESPHRIDELAQELAALAGERLVTVGRELTKQFEEVCTLPAAGLPGWLQASADRRRGEFALVLHAPDPSAAEADEALPAAAALVLEALARAWPLKEAARVLAEATGLPRNRLYAHALAARRDDAAAADEGEPGNPD